MPTQRLIKHGTQAGYKAELETDSVCDRCRNASRVYNRQFTKTGKAQHLKYRVNDVIDNLYKRGQAKAGNFQPKTSNAPAKPGTLGPEPGQGYGGSSRPEPSLSESQTSSDSQPGPSLGERLTQGLRDLTGQRRDYSYIEVDETPDYLHPIEPDQEPASGDWSEVKPDDEFLVTKEGIRAIEDNLGMYLATAGMTLGLIDLYCGTVLRDNLDDMVKAWAKVISHYPSAAKLFMAKGGGKIMAWVDALMATWPILIAIYEHHLSKKVALDSNGKPYRVTTESPNGQFATQPQYNYTVE